MASGTQTDQPTGTQHSTEDPRNDGILIWVNGELVPRERAVVSVFDSGFVLGDGVWEGLRVSGGHPAFLEPTSTASRRAPARSCSTSG